MPVVRISEELFREIQEYAEPLVDDFESALWKVLKLSKRNPVEMPKRVELSARKDVTPQKMFRKTILETLVELGGRGDAQQVLRMVEQKMKGQMKPGDYAPNRDGFPKWEKAVHFQRLTMVHEGFLASNSPRGIWEITNAGRKWLESEKHKPSI